MAESYESLDKILIITPTYNEAENIEHIVNRARVALPQAHCLIVDDNSPDGTGQIADKMAANDKHVHVRHRPGKGGLAAAYIEGFKFALEFDYDVVIEMDADGSHEPELLPRLLDELRSKPADMVKGSRWMKGGTTDQTKPRELLSRAANIWIQVAMDLPVRDATGGYNAYRTSILKKIDLDGVESKGYSFQIDMTRRVLAAGGVVSEVPIHFPDRLMGTSKMDSSIITEALAKTAVWGYEIRKKLIAQLIAWGKDQLKSQD